MAQLSDDEFIAQLRERYVNRRKYILLSVGSMVAALVLSLFGAVLLYQQWIAICRTLTPTTEPFWIGFAFGCLLGTKIALLTVLGIHGVVSIFFAVRGGERTQRLLLEHHDALSELLQQAPNQPLHMTGDVLDEKHDSADEGVPPRAAGDSNLLR